MSRELGSVNIIKNGLKSIRPIPVTSSQFCAALTAGELSPGRYYHLTNKNIYLLALEADKYSEEGYLYDSDINEVHKVWYSCTNNYISRRVDNRGNDYTAAYEFTFGDDWIGEFKWGDDKVYGNKIIDSRVRMIYGEGEEFDGYFSDNTVIGNSYLYLENFDHDPNSYISGNLFQGATLVFVAPPESFTVGIYQNTFNSSSLTWRNIYGFSVFNCIVNSSLIQIGNGGRQSVRGSLNLCEIQSGSTVIIESQNQNTVNIREVTLSSDSLFNWRSDLPASQPTSNIVGINAVQGSFCYLWNIRNANRITLSDSTLFVEEFLGSNGLNDVTVTGGSFFNIDNWDGTTSRINDINVSDRSSLTLVNDTGNRTIQRWSLDKASTVTANNTSQSAQDVIISGWTVELFIVAGNSTNGFVSHNGLILNLTIGRHNQVLRGSNLPLFHFFNTKVVGTAINLTPNTPDEYAGLWFLYGNGISQNPAAPSVIDRFNNISSVPFYMMVTIEMGELPLLPNIAYLKIQKSPKANQGTYAGQTGRFQMPADLVLEGTGGTLGNGGESITFYKQFQGELMQLDTITYR